MRYEAGVDERDVLGLKAHTFYNKKGNIRAEIATGDGGMIVAFPKRTISRATPMGDAEYDCLQRCRAIQDDAARVQCIVLCPVTKKYSVFIV